MDSPSAKTPTQLPTAAAPATAVNHNENEVFDVFVDGPGDIRGMIAYCIYRFEKKNHFHGSSSTVQQRDSFRLACITGRKYDAINGQASDVVSRFVDIAIKRHSAERFWKDFRIGVYAGLFTAIIGPLFWYVVQYAIEKSHAAAEVESIVPVISTHTQQDDTEYGKSNP